MCKKKCKPIKIANLKKKIAQTASEASETLGISAMTLVALATSLSKEIDSSSRAWAAVTPAVTCWPQVATPLVPTLAGIKYSSTEFGELAGMMAVSNRSTTQNCASSCVFYFCSSFLYHSFVHFRAGKPYKIFHGEQ